MVGCLVGVANAVAVGVTVDSGVNVAVGVGVDVCSGKVTSGRYTLCLVAERGRPSALASRSTWRVGTGLGVGVGVRVPPIGGDPVGEGFGPEVG